MGAQLKRAKRRTDTQDVELVMDLMVVLSKEDARNADNAVLERLAQKLELRTLPDLSAETMAIKKLVKERHGQSVESTEQIIDLLNKFKQLAGIEDNNGLKDINLPKYFEKCPSLMIPSDFLCPITLEIMTDPVIVASGQVIFHGLMIVSNFLFYCWQTIISFIIFLFCRRMRDQAYDSGLKLAIGPARRPDRLWLTSLWHQIMPSGI